MHRFPIMAFVVPVLRKNYILYSIQQQPSQKKKSQSRTEQHSQILTTHPAMLSTLENNSITMKSTQNISKKNINEIILNKSVKSFVQHSSPNVKSDIEPADNINNAAISTNSSNQLTTLKFHRPTTALSGLTSVLSKKEDLIYEKSSGSIRHQMIFKEKKIVNDQATTSISHTLPSVSGILPSKILTRPPIDKANQQNCEQTLSTATLSTSQKIINLSSQSAPSSPTFTGAYSARQMQPRLHSERISIQRLNDENDDKLKTPLVRHVHFGFCEQIEYEDSNEKDEDEKLSKLKQLEKKLTAQFKFPKCATIFRPCANTACSLVSHKSKISETKPQQSKIFDELGRAHSAENI